MYVSVGATEPLTTKTRNSSDWSRASLIRSPCKFRAAVGFWKWPLLFDLLEQPIFQNDLLDVRRPEQRSTTGEQSTNPGMRDNRF